VQEETPNAPTTTENGFRISDQPLCGTSPIASPREGQSGARENAPDLLYVIARDPRSLFLYWDLNWTRLFARAGLSPRQVHLRIYRGNGSIEGTQEINPFRGHCYAEVAGAGTEYYCELGSFDSAEWTSLVRSRTTATPEARMSDDLSGEFATLPIHLSFQRLLEIFGGTSIDPAILTRFVAELQENARILQQKVAPGDWSRRAMEIAAKLNGGSGHGTQGALAVELAEVVEIALRSEAPAAPTAEDIARWKELGERFGGSSWTGASSGGLGGSSPA
jgi:hypothetical protein